MNTSNPTSTDMPNDPKDSGYSERVDTREKSRVVWTPPDVFRLLAALTQRLGWLIAAPIIGLIMATGYMLINGSTYQIDGQLMVRVGPELAAPATIAATNTQPIMPIAKTIEDITGEVQIMKDPGIIVAVVESLGEDFFYGEDIAVTFLQKVKKFVKDTISNAREFVRNTLVMIGLLPELSKLERVIVLLQRELQIEHVTRSDVIHISIGYPDPELGEVVLERFIEFYLQKRAEIYDDDRIAEFFDRELDTIGGDLKTAEERYTQLSEATSGWSIENQRTLAVERRAALRADLDEATTTIEVALVNLSEIEKKLAELPELEDSSASTARSTLFDQLRFKETELWLELEAEKSRSGIRSQQVQILEQQLEQIRATLSEVPAYVDDRSVRAINPLRQSMEVQRADTSLLIETTRKRIENLNTNIAQVEDELRQIDQASLELARQLRQIERLRASEISFQQAQDDARISDLVTSAAISNVVVISEPQGSVAPVRPRVMRTFITAILFSFVAVSGVILVIDALRPKVRNNADLLDFCNDPTIVRAIA